MTDTILLINTVVMALMLVGNLYNEKLHRQERKELYNRLMARDLAEYTAYSKERPPAPVQNFVLDAIERSKRRQREFDSE